MAASVNVHVSGPVLSSLFYENMNSTSDQEGFLIGEINSHITDIISDSQISNEKEEIVLSVYSVLPCPEVFSFYDYCGKICKTKLNAILGKKQKDIIGWYRFRRNTDLEVMLRERAIHMSLLEELSTQTHNFFLFAVFTATNTNNLSTYSFDHVFLRMVGSSFEAVPVSIINLGDTSQSEYKLHPHLVVNTHSGTYSDLIHSTNKDGPGASESVTQIQNIQMLLQDNLKRVANQVAESEKSIQDLLVEIELLKKQQRLKQQIPKSPSSPQQVPSNRDITWNSLPDINSVSGELQKIELQKTKLKEAANDQPASLPSPNPCNIFSLKLARETECQLSHNQRQQRSLEDVNCRDPPTEEEEPEDICSSSPVF